MPGAFLFHKTGLIFDGNGIKWYYISNNQERW